jgi:hypothetical protein
MKTYACGFDPGNSDTTVVIKDGDSVVSKTIPSYTATETMERLSSIDYHLKRDDFIYKDDDTEEYVGSLARRQSTMASSGYGDVNRYWDDRSKHLLLTVSSSLIEDKEYELLVVTGLPIRAYVASQRNRQKVRKCLEGEHHFTINGRDNRTVHINTVRVVMEGAGAMISYGLPGRHRQGVIDIGGFTTDLFASEGQEPLQQYCDGVRLGVEHAGRLIATNFEAKYGREPSRDELSDILRGKIDTVYVDGEQVDGMKAVARSAVDEIGRRIASEVASRWNNTNKGIAAGDFARVILIGGGAHYFLNHIRSVIPAIATVNEPEKANAVGYATLAAAILERKNA